ncbi:MAG: hypothetical protein KAG94_01250 [Clostridiales bacterium]|nr:hypothetical protein [Clostridiales bacterium]
MKKVFIGIFIIAFTLMFLIAMSNSISLFTYNESLPETNVSNDYIHKSVTKDSEEIIFNETKDAETGSANIVTSIVVNYRSFDTLGEVTVLFLSAMGVMLLIGSSDLFMKRKKSGFILRTAAKILFPVLLVVGTYIFTHGHLGSGGGFPGGTMIASSFLLLYLADEKFVAKIEQFKTLLGSAGTLYILIGLTGLLVGGYFLQNFLPTGTVGNLLSSGIIPVVYISIGLKVGSEVTLIISSFLKEEVTS